jgi:uncharacterized protein (DUF2235 family)
MDWTKQAGSSRKLSFINLALVREIYLSRKQYMVRSMDMPFAHKLLISCFEGGLGLGLNNDVTQCYEFITDNYQHGDELFFFGFSRGAFTARSVAGLISNVGVLSSCDMAKFPELWKAYRMNTSGQLFKDTKWYAEHAAELRLKTVPIKVVGVWETVGALVSPYTAHWRPDQTY